jgi:hypothetical protein
MILRGPGSKEREEFPSSDRRVYDFIGQEGEKILPFYRYYIIWKDLYTVHGGFVNWTSEGLGIFSFTNELWSSQQYYNESRKTIPDEDRYAAYQRRQKDRLEFDDLVELGARYKEWKPFDHPDYGKIELGGWVRQTNRIPPLFMLEELCHRNALFTLFHADQMPLLSIDSVSVAPLNDGVYQIRAVIANQRAIPSISAIGAKNRLIRPDIVTVNGSEIKVLSAGLVQDRWLNRVNPVEKRPERVLLPEGIPGNGNRIIQFVISGKEKGIIMLDSQKGGRISREFQLK